MFRKIFLFFIVLAAAFCFQLAPLHAAKSTALDLAILQKKQVAVSFLQNGQYEAAYSSFMSLLREDPADDEINFGILLSAYNSKRYTAALLAAERLVDKYPADSDLRLHLSRIYIALDEKDSARMELENARRFNSELSPKKIEEILSSLEKQGQRFFASGSLSFGVMYDTNSNQGPKSNTLNLGVFDGLVVDGVKSNESWANYLSASLNLSYRLGEDSPWWFIGDLTAYQRWNTSAKIQSNNQTSWGKVAGGLRYIGSKSIFDVKVKHEEGLQTHKRGEDEIVYSTGPELMLVLVPDPDFQLITLFNWDLRDYTVSNGRDGQYLSFGQYARYFFGESKHYAMLGVRFTTSEADIKAYNSKSQEPFFSLYFNLPYDFKFSPRVGYKYEEYSGPATGLETNDREDRQLSYGANLAWDISESLSLDFDYQYLDNKSNSALYEYKQQVIRSGVTLKF